MPATVVELPWENLRHLGVAGLASLSRWSEHCKANSHDLFPCSMRRPGVGCPTTPFFGPFGRFYVGPTIWAAYLGFSRSTLEAKGEKINLEDGLGGGLGLDCGFLAGRREQIDINFSFRGDFAHGGSIFFLFGVGLHR